MNFHKQPHTFVAQVDLKIQDMERSLEFYQKVIGFKILERSDRKVWLTADGKTPLLSLEQPEVVTRKQTNRTGLYHFALLLPNRSDLGRILLHLIKSGVQIGAGDHLVSEALYFSDPDGNGIEIYIDRPDSLWEWKNGEVKMTTEQLDADSILAEGKGEPWLGLPSETVMGHIHLHVSDLKEAEKFYNILGFDVVCKYPGAIFISTGGYHHHIGLNVWSGVGAPTPSETSVGLKLFSIIYPDKEKRERVLEQLKNNNIKVDEKDGNYFVLDPSGNQIKLAI